MAPELLMRAKHYTKAIDCWAVAELETDIQGQRSQSGLKGKCTFLIFEVRGHEVDYVAN